MQRAILITLSLCAVCNWLLGPTEAQAKQKSTEVGQRATSVVPWTQQDVRFSDEHVATGLPVEEHYPTSTCSEDGTTFIDQTVRNSSDQKSASEFYSVLVDGKVTKLERSLPADYEDIKVQDFYVAEHVVVTLLKGVHQNPETQHGPDVHYFLSLSQLDGSDPEVLPLEINFRPLKVALVGSGDYLVLGWDEINLTSVLVLLKEDGKIRKFLQLDSRTNAQPYTTFGSAKEAESFARSGAAEALLGSAKFVAYGSQVLLTYPGTARSIQVLSALGEDRSIPISLPKGFVLHDALVSGARYSLVLRVQPVSQETAAHPRAAEHPQLRVFVMSPNNGSILAEVLFDKPSVEALTCAAAGRFTVVYASPIPNAVLSAPDQGIQAEKLPEQMVVATAPR